MLLSQLKSLLKSQLDAHEIEVARHSVMSTSMYMFINNSDPYMSYNFVFLGVEIIATFYSSFLHPSNENAKTNVNKFSCTTDCIIAWSFPCKQVIVK